MSAPVRGSSLRPLPGRLVVDRPGAVGPVTPVAGGDACAGGSGGGLVIAWASAGSTVMITGTANAPVPMVALRRNSLPLDHVPCLPSLFVSPLLFPIPAAMYRSVTPTGTPTARRDRSGLYLSDPVNVGRSRWRTTRS